MHHVDCSILLVFPISSCLLQNTHRNFCSVKVPKVVFAESEHQNFYASRIIYAKSAELYVIKKVLCKNIKPCIFFAFAVLRGHKRFLRSHANSRKRWCTSIMSSLMIEESGQFSTVFFLVNEIYCWHFLFSFSFSHFFALSLSCEWLSDLYIFYLFELDIYYRSTERNKSTKHLLSRFYMPHINNPISQKKEYI